jgi:ATP-binding cassette subfamily B protein
MNGLAACERVFQVLDMPEPAGGKSTLPAGGLAAEADDLSFAYGEERAAALAHVFFSAPACGLTGLAGASGCGKSTLAGLLSGRLPAADCEGVVKVGGVSLCDVKRSELRKRVCLVTHEDYIFTGTVSENLRMAKPDAADNELSEALGKVRLRDFFAERDGLDTELTEGGANLSGGQRQRLSLARALLRDADMYIFDEATSNIDSESEETVLTVIRELAKTKNVLLISHRLANLTGADVLYAMEGGRIAETGTHAELLSANGVYARLFREQKALEAFATHGGDNPEEEGFAETSSEAPEGAAGSADDPNVMTGRGSSRGLGVAKRLASFVKPMAGIMILAILLGAAGHAAAILLPVLGGFALLSVDGFAGTPSDLGGLFAALIVCAVLRGLFRYAEQLCNHYIAFKLLAELRSRVFAALRRLCPAKLECREKGDLIAVITGDIELLEVFYAHTISPVAIAIVVSASSALFIGSFHPLLGLAAVCSYLIVGALVPYISSLFGQNAGTRLREAAAGLSAYYLDSLRGMREILGMGIGEARKDGIGRMSDEAERLQRPAKSKEGAVSAVSGLFVTLCSLWMLALSYMLLLNEAAGFEVKGIFMPFIVLFSSFGPVLALANLSAGLPSTFAAARRVFALLDETPETADVEDGKTPDFDGAECRNLNFAYETGDAVLQDISAVFPKGGVTGITGRSGSGKSTLLRLLMRFWQPPRGSTFLSHEDINDVDTAHLRTLEGFMTQETDIFSDTVENNIKTGKPEATREEVIAAAKKAALHDFVMTLPEGYDTRIGGAGAASADAALSGGERQRIGLARAFLYDAPFLLLDEPTSNLDSLNEAIILNALREEGAGRTVALVSHRKSTMGVANRVYSADSGRLS